MCDAPFLQTLSYVLSIEPYLNTYSKQYQNILTIDKMPMGPLSQMVSRYSSPKLSPFQGSNDCCTTQALRAFGKLGILRQGGNRENYFLTEEDVPGLLGYLTANGYAIDTSITKVVQKAGIMMQNKRMVCVLKYTNV